ncbi:PLU-1-domain-containing protein [Microthyrium microscopicum]|uniref:PLU-1-domain-containing protein n=1 Tax=Microthyrium microscopicum TaxID=703497 RepID=A0A6A6U0J3_9PEZI|nr:PLU-1-domain-containing protein [Microthyrium microscopicum]
MNNQPLVVRMASATPSASASATASQPPPPRARMASATAPPSAAPISSSIPLSARKSAVLDMNTVERRGQTAPLSSSTAKPKASRPHDLQEAPTFRPTEEEFKNGPIEYIQKIAEEGRKYGIVKIIPPEGWKPPFVVDSEKFHFRTRKQELNQTDGGTRANLNYLDNLAKFHKQRSGTALNRFPSVDKRPLDLYKLKKFVEDKGGFDAVCKGKRWAEIGRDLGYSGKIMSSLSTSLKNSYSKWLQPYEDWLKENKPAVLQAQHERENGTPYTPSPGPNSTHHTPLPAPSAEPAMKASQILNAQLNESSAPLPPAPIVAPIVPPPIQAPSGFTAVNTGFTAVNAPPPSGFAAINAPIVAPPAPEYPTPHSNGHSPMPSVNGTPMIIDPSNPPINGLKRQNSVDSESLANGDESGRRSKRAKKGDSAPTVTGSQMMQPRLAAQSFAIPRDRSNDKPGDCDVCGKGDEAGASLVCDSCDMTFHKACLDQPPKTAAPEGDWHCPRCLVGTQEYGFEEGGTYSLKQFQEKAQNFKARHFAKKNGGNPDEKQDVSEDEVEREFWRLTESLTETVEVEYGADIHSTTHGSGFPTIERQPFDSYSMDPWNLNVMPLDKDSLFRYIKTDISGMTVPWLYVGMCFSTFCWHNEDHWTYSANYQHFGETKTWYGIPSGSAERFEAAMKETVPELFEQQPDLLYQLVTLLQPDKLRKAGVEAYALDQHAGEFVITFPQAYHAGFNHGFNFNEAVNFAPSDWEPFGSKAIERLQEFKRPPVFSHEELLFAAAEPLLSSSTKDHSITTAKWLAPALQRIISKELKERNEFEQKLESTENELIERRKSQNLSDQGRPLDNPDGPTDNNWPSPASDFPYTRDEKIVADEEMVCILCKRYAYCSRFICHNSKKILCLSHCWSYDCCNTSQTDRLSLADYKHEVYIRESREDLQKIITKVTDISKTPEAWEEKLDALLEDEPRPALKTLRSIVTEGEKIDASWPLQRLVELKEFVARCNAWVEEATAFTARKTAGRRKSEMRSRGSISEKKAETSESKKDALRNPENIKKLLKSAADLGFECPELEKLHERWDRIKDFRKKARTALDRPHITASELTEVIDEGKDIDMDLPEMKTLDIRVRTVQWFANAKDYTDKMSQGSPLSLDELVEFIEAGKVLEIREGNDFMVYFNQQKTQGDFWESKAKEIMSMEAVNFHQLDALYKQASQLPVSRNTLSAIDEMLKKQREAQERIMILYERTKSLEFRDRPNYKEVRDTMEGLAEMNSKPPGTLDLEREQKRHEDWMRRGKKLFGKANAPLHILLQHMQFVQERNAACLDLSDKPRMPVEPASREQTPDEPAFEEAHGSSRDVFCICRKPESGMMIECEMCHEWYHGRCLKIARGKVKEDDKYTCPICDYRVKIPRDAARPKLEELLQWQDEIYNLPFQPEEEYVLEEIINVAQEFRIAIGYLINPVTSTPDDLPVQRFFLRKIEGADVLLTDETNFLRQAVHRCAPVAPEPPRMIEVSLSTRKPRPTKAQKLMSKMGVQSIDDLPENLRPKAPKNRKHPYPDGHRSGKGSIPANPSSNAKPGESISVPTTYAASRITSSAHKNSPSLSHSARGSTSTANSNNGNDGTPTFAFDTPPMREQNHTPVTNSAPFVTNPASPLFDTYGPPSGEPSRAPFANPGTFRAGNSIDPQLDNLFAHPSGLHSGLHNTTSPEHDHLDPSLMTTAGAMASSISGSMAGAAKDASESMDDHLFGSLTNGGEDYDMFNGRDTDMEDADDRGRY